MEDKFYNDEFEDFLNEQVKNHRMYPSDSVWRKISEKIHDDKKWPALTAVACLFLIATITVSVYFSPKPNIFAITATAPVIENKNIASSTSALIPSNKLDNNFQLKRFSSSSVVTNTNRSNTQSLSKKEIPVENSRSVTTDKSQLTTINTSYKLPEAINIITLNNSGDDLSARHIESGGLYADTTADKSKKKDFVREQTAVTSTNSDRNDDDDKSATDKFLKEHLSDLPLYTTTRKDQLKNKFSYQIYLTPSVSFRQLQEDPSINILEPNMGGPVALNYVADVNKIVRHKPGMGLEAGFNILYNISDVVRLKSGIQFNARQYSISAFKSSTELASIALIRNHGIDTVNTLATYRTGSGYSSAELLNKYYQISIPVGIEWQVFGNKRVQFNVAGSIQPTYLLNRNTYLLSTNLKNYTENAAMVRSFNVNSNIEAFMTFKVGDFRWQLGPQWRYQNYSTFIKDYPINEYLMDYGFKVGVSKTIR